MSQLLAPPKGEDRHADMQERMRSHVHWIYLSWGPGDWYYTAPGCSPGPLLCCSPWLASTPRRPGDGCCLDMARNPCRDKEKEWFIEDGNLCTPAACWILWYFAIMGVWWVDLLRMIGSRWFLVRSFQLASHDWERMVFGPCISFSNFAISQGPKSNSKRLAIILGKFN